MKLFIVLVHFALLVAGITTQEQKLELFDQFDGTGSSVAFQSSYISDLASEGFDNAAQSVCVTGTWILYQDPEYNPNGDAGVEYVFGPDNYCINLKTLSGQISSIRYAGHPKDYTIDSFTIYQYTFFQGKEEYAYNQIEKLEKLSDSHQSIIITGSSDWTVFDQPNFQGNSACLKVPESEKYLPAFITDMQKDANNSPGIPNGSIMSVRKGCYSVNKMILTSFSTA